MYNKNASTIKWPSLTAKIGKRRKKSFIGSTPGLLQRRKNNIPKLKLNFLENENNPVVDPIKLFFFASEEFFRFLLISLSVFGKYDKNVSTIKWPSLTAKIKKRRKKSFIGSAPGPKNA